MAPHGMDMRGAAVLAATAALHAGAGRVILSLLSGHASDSAPPDVMQREFKRLALEKLHVVCGCGGGTAVEAVLPEVLQRSACLVLDADGLNAVAQDSALQNALRQRGSKQPTVITPHPLEAARLLVAAGADVTAATPENGTALVVAFSLLRAWQQAGHFAFEWADGLLLGAMLCASLGYVYGARVTPSPCLGRSTRHARATTPAPRSGRAGAVRPTRPRMARACGDGRNRRRPW